MPVLAPLSSTVMSIINGMKTTNTLALIVLLILPISFTSIKAAEEESAAQHLSWLEKEAKNGDNVALYTLGYIYLQQTKISAPDLDKAYKHLIKVKGSYKNSANILIGYIYSKGTKNIEQDIKKTTIIFKEASLILKSKFKELNAISKVLKSMNQKSVKDYMQRSIQAQKDHNLLYGWAEEYGIKLQ